MMQSQNTKRRRRLATSLVAVAALATVWLVANPSGRFGWCCYAFTSYGPLPTVISDIQIRANGSTRTVAKTHLLSFEQVEWLLDPKPEVLIIALGWDGVTSPDDKIRGYQGCDVRILRNKEAIELFNLLKAAGKRVAIHYHSTC